VYPQAFVFLGYKQQKQMHMDRVCGLDVHKDSVFMCILRENGEKIEGVFGTLTPELDRLRDQLVSYEVGKVAMESTCIYWIPIWRALESDFDVKLVNPYFIRQLPGRKTDVKDAQWIATVLQNDLIKDSYVPGPVIQQLRQYNRRMFYINRNKQRSEQALDLTLQRCNIRLSNYVSGIGSKSMRKVVAAVINGERDATKLLLLVHKRIRNKRSEETIRDSLIGVVSQADIDMLRMPMEEVNLYARQLAECSEKMTAICEERFQLEMQILQTAPGIKKPSAMSIIAEIGVDMKTFITAAALVGRTGLRPRNDLSAGKIKGRKALHGNKYLRIILIQCAWAASRTKESRLHRRYEKLKKRMNHNKSIVANARKLLIIIWNMLVKKQFYAPLAA
jgi:transposase